MDAVAVPAPIIAELSSCDGSAPLLPLARIRNTRTAYALRGADGGVVAEFVDDHVPATDVRAGVDRAWREWEFELGAGRAGGPRRVFAAVDGGRACGRRPGGGIRFEARSHPRGLIRL